MSSLSLSLSICHSATHSRSLQQSGLITRVTDTVKSIVPSWLQNYFNSGDAAADEEGDAAEQGAEQDSQTHPPPNGSEEGPPPPLDGWDSPEPSTSHTGEACRDVISPPPGHRWLATCGCFGLLFLSCVHVVVFGLLFLSCGCFGLLFLSCVPVVVLGYCFLTVVVLGYCFLAVYLWFFWATVS